MGGIVQGVLLAWVRVVVHWNRQYRKKERKKEATAMEKVERSEDRGP